MDINIKYFGQVAEITGKTEDNLVLEDTSTVKGLNDQLRDLYQLESTYYRISVNQEIMNNEDAVLNEGDEIALLPPFAGG